MDKDRNKYLKSVEAVLKERLMDFLGSLHRHDALTSQALPENSTEAAPVIREMGIVEAQERLETAEVYLIRAALLRIQKGTYGLCAQCGKSIAPERLKALPEAGSCMPCANRLEQK